MPLLASDDIKVKERETGNLKTAIYYRMLDDSLAEESLDQANKSADFIAEKLRSPAAKGNLS